MSSTDRKWIPLRKICNFCDKKSQEDKTWWDEACSLNGLFSLKIHKVLITTKVLSDHFHTKFNAKNFLFNSSCRFFVRTQISVIILMPQRRCVPTKVLTLPKFSSVFIVTGRRSPSKSSTTSLPFWKILCDVETKELLMQRLLQHLP